MLIGGADPGSKWCAAFVACPFYIYRAKKESPDPFCVFMPEGYGSIAFEDVSSWKDDDPYTAFKFGRNTGNLEMALRCSGFELVYVHAQVWQREFGLGGTYHSRAARKRAHRDHAKNLWPEMAKVITLETADGILLCEYNRRRIKGELRHGKDPDLVIHPASGIVKRESVID